MKIEQPCVAIKLKNLYDIQYLLDSNNNIVFVLQLVLTIMKLCLII